MCNQQLPGPGFLRHARGHHGRRMEAAMGEFLIAAGIGRFVNQNIDTLRQLDSAPAVGGIRAIGDASPGNVRPAEIPPIKLASIVERDALASLEPAVQSAWGNAHRHGFFDIESAGAVSLDDAIAEGLDAMLERLATDREFIVLKDRARFNRLSLRPVGKVCLGLARHISHVLFESGRAINIYAARMTRHSGGSQQPDQAEEVIAVHVRDEDAPDLADLQIALDELVLCAFATIEEPHLGSLGQAQGDARNVA